MVVLIAAGVIYLIARDFERDGRSRSAFLMDLAAIVIGVVGSLDLLISIARRFV